MIRALPRWPWPAALLLATPLALAQYKVVGPDGRISYTDQAPPADARQVQSIQMRGAVPKVPLADLPSSLRPAATRYPVTLYSSAGCAPCNAGRQLLQQRGIPFTERRVETSADTAALVQLSGDRTLPLLTIGRQQVKGLVSSDWHSYLDAAGYPKTSVLPAGYQAPAPAPLAMPASDPAPTAAMAAAPATPPAPAAEPKRDPATPNIRF